MVFSYLTATKMPKIQKAFANITAAADAKSRLFTAQYTNNDEKNVDYISTTKPNVIKQISGN